MFITKLQLKNFRNYAEETFELSEGVNILSGANAQGKTNAGEAVFLLCTGYSPRATRDKQLIKMGEEKATVMGTASTNYGNVTVQIDIFSAEKKSIHINGVETLKIGELLGNITSVFFNPSELKLVQESPEDRRRFLNISLSQMSKNYFYSLNRYNKILSQRNNLIKNRDRGMVLETLPVWDEELTKYAGRIIKSRNDFLEKLTPYAEEKQSVLSGGAEKLKITSENGYYGTEEEIAFSVKRDLVKAYEKDLRLGFTTVGPHRDDMKILLNDDDVKIYGSQGQQRTVALAIKLAEAEIFKDRFNEYPTLILDDVLSELDTKRQKRLIGSLSDIQTILTGTRIDKNVLCGKEFKKFVIENGKIKNKLK